MRAISLLALLVFGCTAPPREPPNACPPAQNTEVAVPARLKGKATIPKVSTLQIQDELAREAERAGRIAERDRANACTAAYKRLLKMMQ